MSPNEKCIVSYTFSLMEKSVLFSLMANYKEQLLSY